MRRGPTQNEQVLALLATGPKTTREILREVPCIVHSRVAELRSRGHEIRCWRDRGDYVYQLSLGGLGEPDSSSDGGGASPPVAEWPVPSDGIPLAASGSPSETEQLTFLAPQQRGAYEEVA